MILKSKKCETNIQIILQALTIETKRKQVLIKKIKYQNSID